MNGSRITATPPAISGFSAAPITNAYCACANSVVADIDIVTESGYDYAVCAASPSPTVASSLASTRGVTTASPTQSSRLCTYGAQPGIYSGQADYCECTNGKLYPVSTLSYTTTYSGTVTELIDLCPYTTIPSSTTDLGNSVTPNATATDAPLENIFSAIESIAHVGNGTTSVLRTSTTSANITSAAQTTTAPTLLKTADESAASATATGKSTKTAHGAAAAHTADGAAALVALGGLGALMMVFA